MTIRKRRLVSPSMQLKPRTSKLSPELRHALAHPAPEIPLPPIPDNPQMGLISVTLGCDPEFFFEQGGEIVGSEKIIGKELKTAGSYPTKTGIVMDGVQVELNPPAGTCRETLAGHMASSFRALKAHLTSLGTVKASFTTCINLSKKELDSLSDDAKKLGCAPSLNRADKKAAVTIDGATSLTRSAGGHIHLGLWAAMMNEGVRERIVDILDILVGNTCVLLDRDPNAAERRKVYGRAGEYRLPKHGLEYRTLSNFWLRAYPLMSFVMGLARQSVRVIAHTEMQTQNPSSYASTPSYQWNPEAVLFAMIGGEEGLKQVRLAINTNNWDLAKANFDRIKPFIQRCLHHGESGFAPDMLDHFETFVLLVKQKGLSAFFPDDPLTHWTTVRIGGTGWESFIRSKVRFSDSALTKIKALPDVNDDMMPPTKRKVRKVKPIILPTSDSSSSSSTLNLSA